MSNVRQIMAKGETSVLLRNELDYLDSAERGAATEASRNNKPYWSNTSLSSQSRHRNAMDCPCWAGGGIAPSHTLCAPPFSIT